MRMFMLAGVPRGQIEIASIDPALGGIYYIFNIPRNPRARGPIRSGTQHPLFQLPRRV